MPPRHHRVGLALALLAVPLAVAPVAFAQSGWEGLRACESSGDYTAQSGQYSGAYQFDAQTHRSVGGDGYAGDDTPAQQDAAAQRLYAQRGSQPWPNCGKHLSGQSARSTPQRTEQNTPAQPARPPSPSAKKVVTTG